MSIYGEEMMMGRALTLTAMTLGMTAMSQAATILGYNFNGVSSTTPPTTYNATVLDSAVSGGTLSRGSGITAAGLGNGFASNNWSTTTASFDDANTANNYYQFSFTVAAGNTVSLSALDSCLRRTSAAPSHIEYVYSFDSFATPYSVAGSFDDTLNTGTNNSGENEPEINLSSLSNLQNIPGGTTVTFRLLAYGSTTATSTLSIGRLASNAGTTSTTDLQLVGTSPAATPEPASAALVAMAGAATLLRRRNR